MISLAIKSAFDAIKQVFRTWQCNTEHKLETNLLKDKKDLKKASNLTENILLITDKYVNWFEEKDRKKYNTLKKKFMKLN